MLIVLAIDHINCLTALISLSFVSMDQYLKAKQLIGTTLFWSPLDKYSSLDKSFRIEAELERRKEELGAEHFYYVHPGHSLDGLVGYFRNKKEPSYYLRKVIKEKDKP